jgi:ergothioneine biosynthesis protein EgtB
MTTKVQSEQLVLTRLVRARAETDRIFKIVRPEFLYERPIAERHRIVFYIGHLEAFDWNLLSVPLGLSSFHPDYDRLFAFGIDPVGGNLPADRSIDWPSLQLIYDYCERLRQTLDETLAARDFGDREEANLDRLLNVAIEHRLMHAETLSYLFHQMPFDQKCGSAPAIARDPQREPASAMVHIPAGRATLGQSRSSSVFGWDNEFESYAVDEAAFFIDKYKVTNGHFLRFLEDGGYCDRGLWSQEDWNWKTAQGIVQPAFWIKRPDGWAWRSMFGEIPLPHDWPVYVSHAEASAYAKWSGCLLPTEAQWHRAAYGTPGGEEGEFPWGSEPPAEWCDSSYDPFPVDDSQMQPSAFGVEGMVANGWEWTSTLFAPFPGFGPFDFYPGYSEPFFDGKHFVLKGGSVRTAASMLRRSFRNWFQPHYQYVYAGFRCLRPEK